MTGKFSTIDERRCLFYARFMSGLSLPQANGVYWGNFMFVLFLMCLCANLHHKSLSLGADVKNKRDERRIRLIRKRFLGFVTLCFLIASACAVFEVFALLNIEFCDGEDLIFLYWSFWGFLQVGSIIAVFGVILNLWIAIADVNTPSWAVALGTPVLVFAAIYWILKNIWSRGWKSFTGKDPVDDVDSDGDDGPDEEEGSVEEEEKRQSNFDEAKDMDRWNSRAPTIAPRGSVAQQGMQPLSAPMGSLPALPALPPISRESSRRLSI